MGGDARIEGIEHDQGKRLARFSVVFDRSPVVGLVVPNLDVPFVGLARVLLDDDLPNGDLCAPFELVPETGSMPGDS